MFLRICRRLRYRQFESVFGSNVVWLNKLCWISDFMKSSSCVGKTMNLHMLHAICSWKISRCFHVFAHRYFHRLLKNVHVFSRFAFGIDFGSHFQWNVTPKTPPKSIPGTTFSATGSTFGGYGFPARASWCRPFFGQRFVHAFWSPFGSILAPFGSFWLRVGSLWVLFGSILDAPGSISHKFHRIWHRSPQVFFFSNIILSQTQKRTMLMPHFSTR